MSKTFEHRGLCKQSAPTTHRRRKRKIEEISTKIFGVTKSIAVLLDGVQVAQKLKEQLAKDFQEIGFSPKIAIFQVGENKSSEIYIQKKLEFAREVGIEATKYHYPEDIEVEKLVDEIKKIVSEVDGALIQMPLPKHLDIHKKMLVDLLPWEKDIDGLSTENQERLDKSKEALVPATAVAVKVLLEAYKIEVKDKIVCVIGESKIVGLPIIKLMRLAGAKVYSLNKTTGVASSELADILIVGAGKKHLVRRQNVKYDAVVIDVGFTYEDDKIYGDVDFEDVKYKVSYISKVPGGVGPITVACLMENLKNSLQIRGKIIAKQTGD